MEFKRYKLGHPSTWPTVFNFEKNWHMVKPHLNDPKVQAVLQSCMDEYLYELAVAQMPPGHSPANWKKYDPTLAPWHYETTNDHWDMRAQELAEEAIARGEFQWKEDENGEISDEEFERYNEFESQFYPDGDGYEAYTLNSYIGCSCYWLAPFLKELGEIMFPQFRWEFQRTHGLGFACGCDEDGNIKIIFDNMHFNEPANELLGCDDDDDDDAEDLVD